MTPPRQSFGTVNRPFPVIGVTWDSIDGPGAVGAATVRGRLERLAILGVDVAVIGGPSARTADKRLRARPPVEGRLFLMPSKGTKVYTVGPGGLRPLCDDLRTIPHEEQLTDFSQALAMALSSQDLESRITATRSGDTTIDIRPSRRSVALGNVVDVSVLTAAVRKLAEAMQVSMPSITTDGKRLMVSFSGNAEAMRWVAHHLVTGRGRSPADLIVIGRAFGRINGVNQADRNLLVPEVTGAMFVSCAAERDGKPDHVQWLPSGSRACLTLLDDQIARRGESASSMPDVFRDVSWLFHVDGVDPYREREVETWLSIGNGESGTRGALEEGSAVGTPATLVAGVFGDGSVEPFLRLPVPAPDWTCLRLRVDEHPVTLATGQVLQHRRTLDMKQGLLVREWWQRRRPGQTVRVRTVRFASLDDRQVMAMRAEAVLESSGGDVVWEGCLGVTHAGGPVQEAVVRALPDPGHVITTQARNGGGHTLAVSTAPAPGSDLMRKTMQSREAIGGWMDPGARATVDRFAAVESGVNRPPTPERVVRRLRQAQSLGFDEMLRRHVAAWDELWERCDIEIDGDPESQRAIRFAIFHMLSSTHPTKTSVSVGARGLSGLSYLCHVFWDTEVFVVPFLIYTWPEAARTLLTYRYVNLDGAREKAKVMGHRGALFPWESADKGTETTPPFANGPLGEKIPILSGIMEHHISADVAWAVWEYWKASDDDEFMAAMGVELLLETARFWASRARMEPDGLYHIPLVVGPDEYHEEVDDNAFTNVLARWNIRRSADALAWLQTSFPRQARSLARRLGITESELDQWQIVADNLVDGFDTSTLVYEQFRGFHKMAEVHPSRLQPKPMPADLLLGREVTLGSKVIKQGDVLMLAHMLPEEFSTEVTRANYEYYEPFTCHGSSLSPAIHAAVSSRIGLPERALDEFRMARDVDLSDNLGSAAGGIHMATMGGMWQAVVQGFGGVRRIGESLLIDPHLPTEWPRITFAMRFRGSTLRLTLTAAEIKVAVRDAPLKAQLAGRVTQLEIGDHAFRRQRSDWVSA